MTLAIPFLVAAVVVGPAGNAQKLDLAAELRSLVEVERAFARDVGARGMREGFLAHLAEDGVVFRPGPVNGRQWFSERPASTTHLSWTPIHADVARSGDLGYTTGPWELRPKGARGAVTGYGHYVTLWRKQPDGTWKAALDVGITNPRPRTSAPARAYRPGAPAGPTVLRPSADPDSERVVLLDIERALSAAAESLGTARAYESYAARDLRLYRPDRFPLVGLPAARAVIQRQSGVLRWQPEYAEVSRAGDLAFVYGSYRYGSRATAGGPEEYGYYARIWKRQTNGAWRVVLDLANPAPRPEGKS